MKTIKELHSILQSHPFAKINSHVHTHLCDGAPDMTVANIAAEAEKEGYSLIILTPHFHKQVSDGITTLYEDSDETIFLRLREEIDHYEKTCGKVQFLLSTEADILSIDGEISIKPSPIIEKSLDLISPTLNYHPLLPLSAVCVTHIAEMDEIHESSEFARMADAVGGKEAVIETAFSAEINALKRSPYPAMLGHFLIKHTRPANGYTWFGETEAHLPLIQQCTRRLLDICRETGAMIDLTGMHLRNGRTPTEQRAMDGFLYDYQCQLVRQCRELHIPIVAGSDAHGIGGLGESHFYAEHFS